METYYNGKKVTMHEADFFAPPYHGLKTCNYVIIDGRKKGELVLELDFIPQELTVRPLSYNITADVTGTTLRLPIEKPCNLALESGDWCFFVLAYSDSIVNRADYEHIISFGKGVHEAGIIEIENDNTAVFVDEGAYVHGKVLARDKKNIAVFGNGIISMEHYEKNALFKYEYILDIANCENVKISGVTLTDCNRWNVKMLGCREVEIDNIKIFGSRGNSDGIDICSCQNVLVTNCFTRVWDDSLVVKAFDAGDCENIVFKKCVLWNDFARPIEVGVELRCDHVRDVYFEDIDILHSPTGYPVLGIHHGDRAQVENVHFKNIRIEDAPAAQLFDIRITDSVWNSDNQKGSIRDIYFEDISINTENDVLYSNSRLQGFCDNINVSNVYIKNISKNGKYVGNADELGLDVYDYVENVVITADKEPKLELIKSSITAKEKSAVLSLENTTDKEKTIKGYIAISPSSPSQYGNIDFDVTLKPYEKYSKTFDLDLPPGKYCLHLESRNQSLMASQVFYNVDLILGESLEQAKPIVFEDCYGEIFGEVKLALKDDLLMIKSELLKENELILYAAKPVPIQENQVVFSCEETDWAKSPALVYSGEKIVPAPQLRCPAEITYVFKNEPKVEKISAKNITKKKDGISYVPLKFIELDGDSRNFWLDVKLDIPIKKRYPVMLFKSQIPCKSTHMFVNVIRKKDKGGDNDGYNKD